jgi:hypothetical protein
MDRYTRDRLRSWGVAEDEMHLYDYDLLDNEAASGRDATWQRLAEQSAAERGMSLSRLTELAGSRNPKLSEKARVKLSEVYREASAQLHGGGSDVLMFMGPTPATGVPTDAGYAGFR